MAPLEPTDWATIGSQLVKVNAVIIFTMMMVGFTFKKIFQWVFKLAF